MDMQLEQWLRRVHMGMAHFLHPGDDYVIAAMCFNAEKRGENCGVWHQAARWYRDGRNCHCVPCSKQR